MEISIHFFHLFSSDGFPVVPPAALLLVLRREGEVVVDELTHLDEESIQSAFVLWVFSPTIPQDPAEKKNKNVIFHFCNFPFLRYIEGTTLRVSPKVLNIFIRKVYIFIQILLFVVVSYA